MQAVYLWAHDPRSRCQAVFYCFYLVIILVSGSFLASGIYEACHSAALYNTGLLARGKVQKVKDESNADVDWTTYEVTFVAADHNTYTIRNHYSTADDLKLYQVGQSVAVVYLPTDPEDGRLDNNREKYGVYGGCFMGALFSGLAGALVYYFFHRSHLHRNRAAVAE